MNSFNVLPVWLDTDTSTGANTNWRGSSGCTLAGIGSHGIKPTRIMIVPAVTGTANRRWNHNRHRPSVLDRAPEYSNRVARRLRTFRHPADLAGTDFNAVAGFRCDRAIDFDQGGVADLVSHVTGRTRVNG